MNTSVDVLAVMLELDDELQSAANYSGEGCYWSVDDDDLLQRSAAARAAVAELIEAAQPVAESLLALINDDNAMTPQAIMTRRITNALSRVRGSA